MLITSQPRYLWEEQLIFSTILSVFGPYSIKVMLLQFFKIIWHHEVTQRQCKVCEGLWRSLKESEALHNSVKLCKGVWRGLKVCEGLWRDVKFCKGVWRFIKGCKGLWRGVKVCENGANICKVLWSFVKWCEGLWRDEIFVNGCDGCKWMWRVEKVV